MDTISEEVRQRLGLVPNVFRLDPDSPEIAAKLWESARYGYLDNPLPPLFKERLFVWLSRFCEARYCIARHVGFLLGLGRVAGDEQCAPQSLDDVLRLLRRPVPLAGTLEVRVAQCSLTRQPIAELPPADSELEWSVFVCATQVFLKTPAASKCLAALRHAFCATHLENFSLLLAFIHTEHIWSELHPEISFEDDVRQLLSNHKELNECLLGDAAPRYGEREERLLDELDSLRHEKQALESERHRRLEDELAESRVLHRISNELIGEEAVDSLYSLVVDAAARLLHAPYACIQVMRAQRDGSKGLELLAHRGFTPETLALWRRFSAESATTCAAALEHGQRIVVSDVRRCEFMEGCEDLPMFSDLGIVAMQTTPLYSRAGALVGTISTYWSEPHVASEHEFQLLDILGRQAADLIERACANEAVHASERRLRTIIEQLPAGVGVSDMTGRWTLSNSLMEKYVPTAIPSRAAERTALWRARDEHGNPVDPKDWPGARALRGETVVPGVEMLYTDETGRESWMRVSSAPLRDIAGKVTGACSVIQDITQIKRAEERLKEADRRKDEFLATLAHELRNPLAPIRNGLHLICSGGAGNDFDGIHQMLERQVEYMVRLIDDLMEVSRITSGKVHLRLQPVDLTTAINDAVESSRTLIDSAGHHLIVSLSPAPLIIDADPVRITQVIANLVNNAAKYTSNGGKIWLTAYRDGSDCVVSVRDNGMGIPKYLLPKVFDLFAQAGRTYSRAQGGLGIGLTLVRSLVEMHGGKVEGLSDGPGKGSEFRVRLPASESTRAANDSTETQPLDSLFQCRILVVDDNHDAADSLSMLLDMYGAETRVANDGPAALAALGEFQPDVMVLDIGMPGMDGYELARRARAQPGGLGLTLIALSGWGQDEDRRRSKEAGIDHHLVKPVNLDALSSLLSGVAKKRSGSTGLTPG
ncbi:response regulator [Paraburkholderia sp. LEh10]|uniref:ATP-binding protein n=1 Tax=Paraburkholderia sp. LEh10 TaxID=2821353 RepID=UPI001AE30C35|nr:ATP-binding protein [Paraburkholderia sp. LEh10]MBP0588371.1 response regulator [Paraburkholderia sp. LEh10]